MAKKRIRLKKTSRFLILLVLLSIVGFCIWTYKDSFFGEKKKYKSSPEEEERIIEEKKPQHYEANLLMVGDALIHSSVFQAARQSDGSYDFKPMMELIKPISTKYDLAYYNQETILGGPELGFSNYPRFNSPYEVGDAFIDAGFNLVSLATNHTMDKGETGVLNSVNYWKSKKDKVVTSGQWSSFEEREMETSQIYEINQIKYAFLSYTTWTNGLETPYGKEYLNNVYSDELAAADIAKVKDKADVIIVAMHWGNEYWLGTCQEQERIANYLSSLGVHIIIGAHPHVVQPVEYLNEKKTFVIYSLGNFISDQEGNERLTGLMMSLKINKDIDIEDNVTITIDNPRAELIYTKVYYNGRRNFKVYPYPQLDNSLLYNHEALYNRYKGIVSSDCPELQWGITGEFDNGNTE